MNDAVALFAPDGPDPEQVRALLPREPLTARSQPGTVAPEERG